jgi:hypothetical protein
VDRTAKNRYYIYVVQAISAGGVPGSLTTTAPVFVTHRSRSIELAPGNKKATLDGAAVSLSAAPEIRNGLLMIPASALEATGASVSHDGARKVTISRRLESVTYSLEMTIDSPEYTLNGTPYEADVPPYKSGSVVMVPLRVVAPALGLGVTFDSETRTARVGWYE